MAEATFRARERDYWPTSDWREATPPDVGLDAGPLAELDAYARESMPPIRGILIVRRGYVAFERYYDGCTRETLHTVNSVTKSVLSALIGIALREGLLTSLDQRLIDLLPEAASIGDDPRKHDITIRHLLTMTSGLGSPSDLALPLHQRIALDHPDLLRATLERPLSSPPGESFAYDDLSVHLLSIVLTRLTGLSVAAFAVRELFAPLGIWTSDDVRFVWNADRGCHDQFHPRAEWWPDDGWPWKVDQHGHSRGGFGLHLTLREMATFGYLYLNGGRWDGSEIVPDWFVRESTREHNAGGPPVGCPYGYLWWIDRQGNPFASGFGGQTIAVMPYRDMVIAVATTPPRKPPGPIFRRFIAPAIAE